MKNKIFITGAGGFIGSHLVSRFLKNGYKVDALIKYNSKNSWGWLEGFKHKNLKIILGDITDAELLNAIVAKNDYIINLAALIGIPYSYSAVESYYNVNVKGVINLLNSAKKFNIKKILLTSTSEVYGSAIYTPMDEEHPLHGQSPYSASKIASDQLGEAYAKSFNLPVKLVRPFNVYGPKQSLRAIIPTIISQIINNNKVIQLGNVDTIRDYNYVDDITLAFLQILEKTNNNFDILNICSGKEIRIIDLANKLIKISKKKLHIKTDKLRFRPKKSEVIRLLGCNKKIKKLINWSAQTNLDKGLLKTYNWFNKNKKSLKLIQKSKDYIV